MTAELTNELLNSAQVSGNVDMDVKILIIEDNWLAAEELKENLLETGYQVTGMASNKSEALMAIQQEEPDLLIVDIELEDGDSGVDVVRELGKNKLYPVVFLTGKTDQLTVKSALNTNPATYLVKPYNFDELVINIDLAMRKHQAQLTEEEKDHKIIKDAIFVPDQHVHHRINNKDIYTVEADGSYIKIYTNGKNYHLSSNLKNFVSQFTDPGFIRVSRKHLVNTAHIDKIDGNTLYVGPMEIQISKEQRQHILNQFPILKTKRV